VSDLARLNEVATPLAERARAGDSEAFEELVRESYQQIHRWALVQAGDPDDAEDVTQEVLIRLHKGIQRFRGTSRFTTWLFQITRNTAIELHRRRRTRERLADRVRMAHEPESASPARPDQTVAEYGIADVVREFLTELPERQREVFDLVDLQDVAPIDVSEMLDLKPVTVRANLFRARRALRARILERYPELTEEFRP